MNGNSAVVGAVIISGISAPHTLYYLLEDLSIVAKLGDTAIAGVSDSGGGGVGIAGLELQTANGAAPPMAATQTDAVTMRAPRDMAA